MPSPILEVKNVSVSYDDLLALDNVSFAVERGDALAVIGPNGSGKTTLFRAILGVVQYRGTITVAPRVKVGYVPQKLDIERDLPLTAEEFFRLHPAKEKTRGNEELLSLVGLSGRFLRKRIAELSAGEFQRLLIAWALKGNPDILLFDEPTASMDIGGQETVYALLHRLQDAHGLTLLLISHDLSVVYRYATKVLCLNRARVCFGSPRDVLAPEALAKLYGGERGLYHHLHGEYRDHERT